jgi:hypothetical protein
MKHAQVSFAIAMTAISGSLIQPVFGGTFGEEVAFLKQHTEIIVLRDDNGKAQVAVSPRWQGRVMTSTAGGETGASYGWLNHNLIESGQLVPHINVFGGEDRFWIGPEGGQFSVFFARGVKFDLANWFTPAPIDTLPFKVAERGRIEATFSAEFALTNYSGARFEVGVRRSVRLLKAAAAWGKLGLVPAEGVSLVAYETDNQLCNLGQQAWTKETGLLSIWILGQFNPSPATTIVVPIKAGPEADLGVKVTSDYFGNIPVERLAVKDHVIFFSGDGKFRSKIGVNPKRSKGILGSYDADNRVLTLVQFNQPAEVADYVNSLWKLQENPFRGDTINSYNDGPPSPGAKQLGPFYEMESSSPAAALPPGKSISHIRSTIHLSGPEVKLNQVALKTLGLGLDEIKAALPKP